MDEQTLTQLVLDTAHGLGFDLVGVVPAAPSPDYERYQRWIEAGYGGEMAYLVRRAAERADPRSLLPEARTVIVLGANYFVRDLPAGVRNDPSRGLIAAYALGDDYHEVLKPLLFQLDAAIRSASGRTTPGRAYVDAGPVLERSWATAAGLGFIGKNTCLIVPRLGSWLFLAVLLAPEELADGGSRMASGGWPPSVADGSYPLSAIRPVSPGTCGACTRCLDVCPTQAFPEPHVLDARRCISYLTIELDGPIPRELRPLMGNWIFGCDVCQTVCPWNRRYARPAALAAFQARPDLVAPRLLDLLALDEASFRQRFRHSPIQRAKRRGLLRNVCVALGNWGDASALPGLVEALHDAEPLVRGHAAWALGRIGVAAAHPCPPDCRSKRALEQRLADETNAYVRDEIVWALVQMQRT